MAYVLKWDVQRHQMPTTTLMSQYVQEALSPRERRALVPHEMRLVTPFINIGPAQFKSGRSSFAKLMAAYASTRDYSPEFIKSVTPSVDALIFEDGSHVGTDQFQLLKGYDCLRKVEREMGNTLLDLAGAKADGEKIMEFLRKKAVFDRDAYAVDAEPPEIDSRCAFHRTELARTLLATYRRNGIEGLRKQALELASAHQLSPHPKEQGK